MLPTAAFTAELSAMVRAGSLGANVAAARQAVETHLAALPGSELRVWGCGAMVYANVACTRQDVWRCRYLPILDGHTQSGATTLDPLPFKTDRTWQQPSAGPASESIDDSLARSRRKSMCDMWRLC